MVSLRPSAFSIGNSQFKWQQNHSGSWHGSATLEKHKKPLLWQGLLTPAAVAVFPTEPQVKLVSNGRLGVPCYETRLSGNGRFVIQNCGDELGENGRYSLSS